MICNTIGLTADSFESIYTTGGTEVEEVYGAINYAQPIYAKIREMTGTSPLTFTSRTAGTLADYRISGETLQGGTPSPDMPVDVVGCGVRTENLFDESYLPYGINGASGEIMEVSGRFAFYIPVEPNTSYTISRIIGASTYFYYGFTDAVPEVGMRCAPFGDIGAGVTTKTITNENHKYLMFFFGVGKSENIMLNLGSSALPYEPYGYKLPLTCGGTEYPIYLGQVPTTRRIKKLVLTGEENPNVTNSSTEEGTKVFSYRFDDIGMTDILDYNKIMNTIPYPFFYSSHFKQKDNGGSYTAIKNGEIGANSISGTTLNRYIIFGSSVYTTKDSFKSYLAQQYTAGTPVTIWYVLAEPETGIVNEPLHRIGEYADTISFAQAGVTIPTVSGSNVLDMTSTVKPSQMYIKGKIKPDGYGKLVDKNGVYILDKDSVQLTVHGQTDTPNA